MVYLRIRNISGKISYKPSCRMFINTVKRLYIISGSRAPTLGIWIQNLLLLILMQNSLSFFFLCFYRVCLFGSQNVVFLDFQLLEVSWKISSELVAHSAFQSWGQSNGIGKIFYYLMIVFYFVICTSLDCLAEILL